MNAIRFTHFLNEEVKSIAGWYMFSREGTLLMRGTRVLFLVGHGVIDSSCCGFGGCSFALVPGTVVALKYARDDKGRPVSLVAPISDPDAREEIRERLMKSEGVSQVNFDAAGQ